MKLETELHKIEMMELQKQREFLLKIEKLGIKLKMEENKLSIKSHNERITHKKNEQQHKEDTKEWTVNVNTKRCDRSNRNETFSNQGTFIIGCVTNDHDREEKLGNKLPIAVWGFGKFGKLIKKSIKNHEQLKMTLDWCILRMPSPLFVVENVLDWCTFRLQSSPFVVENIHPGNCQIIRNYESLCTFSEQK